MREPQSKPLPKARGNPQSKVLTRLTQVRVQHVDGVGCRKVAPDRLIPRPRLRPQPRGSPVVVLRQPGGLEADAAPGHAVGLGEAVGLDGGRLGDEAALVVLGRGRGDKGSVVGGVSG